MTWLAIKLFFGGLLKRLTGVISTLLGWVGRYPWQAALIVALCLSGWLWRGRQAARVEAAQWEQKFTDQKATYEKAQADALLAQIAADKGNTGTQTGINKEVELVSVQIEAARKDAVAQYARANPVRVCRQAPASAPSGAGPANVPDNPGQPDGPTEIPGMVAITRDDLDDLTREAVQGAERFNYLDALIKEGLAVKASELPTPAF
jgi:hypothetical protein